MKKRQKTDYIFTSIEELKEYLKTIEPGTIVNIDFDVKEEEETNGDQ